MTRKHFQLIASVVNDSLKREDGNTTKEAKYRCEAMRDMALRFASELRHENSRFDAERFLNACFAGTDYEGKP